VSREILAALELRRDIPAYLVAARARAENKG
jgi:hypothetical protein